MTSPYCNSVLFFEDTKPISLDKVLNQLEPYFLVFKNLDAAAALPPPETSQPSTTNIIASQEEDKTPLEKERNIVSANTEQWLKPKQQDTLFWCLFIAHHGYQEYLRVDRNYGVKEMDTKKQIGDFAQKHPEKLKLTNVKLTKAAIQEVRSECLTSTKETSINCLLTACCYYNMNVILLETSEKFFLEYRANDEDETRWAVFKRDSFGKYSWLDGMKTKGEIEEWKQGKMELRSYLKPLKAISAFRADELEVLAKQIGVYDETKKMKKADMYDAATELMKWI
jgi:hypothetical protein